MYAGLPRFNARERGENFSPSQLARLISYARRRGRRLYVTLNTLIKEQELSAVVEVLSELAVMRPHALIVQDLGVVNLIRERFPVLTMHASTQMGIHNSAGARVAAGLGIRRVILERQTTYREIEQISSAAGVELEVFVHGALCCSRSGGCLLSSWMGGHSGNRGRCKQPCRRRYVSEKGNGFFLSTGDLYSLDAVPELAGMGIAGLKIEGRLRSADYVSHVVSAYRLMLDTPPQARPEALRQARGILAGALGRKWTPAVRTREDMEQAIQHTSLGTSGLLCGKVVGPSPDGGMAVEVSRPLRIGDTLRVQPTSGDEGVRLTLTRLAVDGRPATRVRAGGRCSIPGEAVKGALLYKTSSATPDLTARIRELPDPLVPLDLEIRITPAGLTVEVSPGPKHFQVDSAFEAARTAPTSADQIAGEFRRSDSDVLTAGEVAATVDGSVFVPASTLKQIRRRFWLWGEEHIDPEEVRRHWRERAGGWTNPAVQPLPQRRPRTTVRCPSGGDNPIRRSTTARDLFDPKASRADEVVVPDYCPEHRLELVRERLAEVIEAGVRRIRLTSLYAFQLLPDSPDLHLTVSLPLPVCNTQSLAAIRGLGAARATAWVELDRVSMEELAQRDPEAVECFTYGRVPLLSTRFAVAAEGRLGDRRGSGPEGQLDIVRENGLTTLYARSVISLPAGKGLDRFMDLSHARPEEDQTDSFNYDREWV